jgi:hypothetical protein
MICILFNDHAAFAVEEEHADALIDSGSHFRFFPLPLLIHIKSTEG